MDKKWFDSILINFNEGKDDEIVMRAFCDGGPVRRITIPLDIVRSKDFWKTAHDMALEAWAEPQRMSFACPGCATKRPEHHREYKGFRFCEMCGTHYKLVDGVPILIARLE